MPGVFCAVRSCKNNEDEVKRTPSKSHIRFFKCPADQERRKMWIKRCNRLEPNWNPGVFRVCSIHFSPSDFLPSVKTMAKDKCRKPSLKNTAVPHLNCPEDQPTSSIQWLPSAFHARSFQDTPTAAEDLGIYEAAIKAKSEEIKRLEAEILKIKQENMDLQQKLEDVTFRDVVAEAKIQSLQGQLQKYMKMHRAAMGKMTKQKKKQIEDGVHAVLQKYFTKNQIDILMEKKTRAIWTEEEMSTAFTLRYMSKRSYVFMKNTLKYPLPGISSLQRWASQINMRQGLQNHILRVMKTVAPTFDPVQRVAVITFDEVKVRSKREYDQKNDEVVGPHSQMQVVMVRGLYAKWKQQVYVDFDKKMTREILLQIITACHEAGYSVRACTSDMGGGNQGLWKELNITSEKSWIEHPNTGRKIFFFADAPHALKLIRNWLLDSGFLLKDGTKVTKAPLEALLEIQKDGTNPTEVTSCHKLNDTHLKCVKTQRQSVQLAAQLLSHTTATALRKYLPGKDESEAKNLADVISIVNAWFDVCNSYKPLSHLNKCGYGIHLEDQDAALDAMYDLMSTMRCIDKGNSLQVFQKGIIFSINSLKMLRKEMEEEFNMPYLLTHRINQDCLENCFSQLRSRGGLHDHPAPLECLYRLRMIMLGKNPGLVQKGANSLDETKLEDDPFITASFIRRTGVAISDGDLTPETDTDPDNPDEINLQYQQDEETGEEKENKETEEDSEKENCLIEEKDIKKEIIDNQDTGKGKQEIKKEMEEDGLEYIAGWVASKHPKVEWLGQRTSKLPPSLQNFYKSSPTWVSQLSFGGLYQPSKEWFDTVKKIEEKFQAFHGQHSVCTGVNVVQKLVLQLSTTPDIENVPREVVITLVRQRLRIRLKYLDYVDALKRAEAQQKKAKEKREKKSEELQQIQKEKSRKDSSSAQNQEKQQKKPETSKKKASKKPKKKQTTKKPKKSQSSRQHREPSGDKQGKTSQDERRKAEVQTASKQETKEKQASRKRAADPEANFDRGDSKRRRISKKYFKLLY